MKFTTVALSVIAIAAASVSAHPLTARAIDPSLIPDLGTPTGPRYASLRTHTQLKLTTPSHSGCPPSRQDFIDVRTLPTLPSFPHVPR